MSRVRYTNCESTRHSRKLIPAYRQAAVPQRPALRRKIISHEIEAAPIAPLGTTLLFRRTCQFPVLVPRQDLCDHTHIGLCVTTRPHTRTFRPRFYSDTRHLHLFCWVRPFFSVRKCIAGREKAWHQHRCDRTEQHTGCSVRIAS